ncbi:MULTISPECIES: acyltransferase domain-containing protein, partial [unclassified Streptomyces]|uniref:acyltransferase domain-containing protein n=1 Tax=unclassified Streptomyces TaxID=2593676 RepID=UPI003402FEED
ALHAQAERLSERLRDVALEEAALTLAGRTTFEHRAVVIASDHDEAINQLADPPITGRTATSGKTVFVFPGQGSQWVGMGAQLLDQSPVFATRMQECAEALAPYLDQPLLDIVRNGSLDRVDVVQPASFAVMVSLAAVWQSMGVTPDAVLGHSQGEIAAACVSGALSLHDAAQVVALRSQAIRRLLAGHGTMVSLAAPLQQAQELLRDGVEIAAVNGPASVVVAGDPHALDLLITQCETTGIRARKIPVDYASHTSHVERLRDELTTLLADLTPQEPRIPFFSSVDGHWLDVPLDSEYWYRNLRQQVQFANAVDTLAHDGFRVFTETSSHPVLTAAMEDVLAEAGTPAAVVGTLRRDHGDMHQFLTSAGRLWVTGINVRWPLHDTRRADLPTYPFQHERYWL